MSNCSAILVPTEENISDNIASAQAYVYLNAAKDYEELRKQNAGGGSVGFSYKLLSLDASQSNSASEFEQKVRERLEQMGYSSSEASAKTTVRRYLTDTQVREWGDCMGADSVTLTIPAMNFKRATVKAAMRLTNAQQTTLVVKVQGGTIEGKTKWTAPVTGFSTAVFIVECNKGDSIVTLTAEAAGRVDSLDLDFGALRQEGGMIGMKLAVSRRAGTVDTPYPWTPSTIRISPLAVPTQWIAAGHPYMNVGASKYNIAFDITWESKYHKPGSNDFDGFVIDGFIKDIKSLKLLNNSVLDIKGSFTARQVVVDVRGDSPPGGSFVLALTFDETQ